MPCLRSDNLRRRVDISQRRNRGACCEHSDIGEDACQAGRLTWFSDKCIAKVPEPGSRVLVNGDQNVLRLRDIRPKMKALSSLREHGGVPIEGCCVSDSCSVYAC